MADEQSGFSRAMGLGSPRERALALSCGFHDRLGCKSPLAGVDAELVSLILELAELRKCLQLSTEKPDPGCFLYGVMCDVSRVARSQYLCPKSGRLTGCLWDRVLHTWSPHVCPCYPKAKILVTKGAVGTIHRLDF